jgi:hypothetical protein
MTETAIVNYVTKLGEHINLDDLVCTFEHLVSVLKTEADCAKGESKATLIDAAVSIHELLPDLEAMPPKPDPIADAEDFLCGQVQAAQELLRAEAKRERDKTVCKEAWCVPGYFITEITSVPSFNQINLTV